MKHHSAVAERPRIGFEACPLCQCPRLRDLRKADCTHHPLYRPIVPKKMIWLTCADCGHVFTEGYFSAETLKSVFSGTHENQQPGYRFEEQRLISARIVERVCQFASAGKWMDVGFGNGSLLFTAQEWGYVPVGLDLRPASVTGLLKFGIDARCVDMLDIDEPGQFNVISMADVLEHMPFPQKALEAARRLLGPGGVLFISLPNYDCAAWRLLDMTNANPYWAEIEHYHNFSRQRLYTALATAGFEPVQYAVSERYRIGMEVIARRCA